VPTQSPYISLATHRIVVRHDDADVREGPAALMAAQRELIAATIAKSPWRCADAHCRRCDGGSFRKVPSHFELMQHPDGLTATPICDDCARSEISKMRKKQKRHRRR
jgi:hypothetical protein